MWYQQIGTVARSLVYENDHPLPVHSLGSLMLSLVLVLCHLLGTWVCSGQVTEWPPKPNSVLEDPHLELGSKSQFPEIHSHPHQRTSCSPIVEWGWRLFYKSNYSVSESLFLSPCPCLSVDPCPPIIWPLNMKSWLIGKDPDAGKDRRQKKKRAAEDEMVR